MTIEIPSATDIEALALARRSGWPEDLRVLIARFPREQWQGHANLGEMARFWLSRHDMFRELATMIQTIEAQFRTGALSPAEFPRQFVPRLQFLLSQLDVHHQIEDLHYFPIFRAADARLTRGFDVLEGDHHAIHVDMAQTAETANALLRALQGNPKGGPLAGDPPPPPPAPPRRKGSAPPMKKEKTSCPSSSTAATPPPWSPPTAKKKGS